MTSSSQDTATPGLKLRQTLAGLSSTVSDLAWSPDGQFLAASTESGSLFVWTPEAAEPLVTVKTHSNSVLAVAWSHDSQTIATGALDHQVRLWRISSKEPEKALHHHGGPVRTLAWSPTEDLLASGSDDRTIRIWDASSGKTLKILRDHQNWIRSLAWSPDGKQLASSSDDHTIRIWRPKSGALVRTLEAHSLWVLSVAWSPDSKVLASGSADRTLRVWDPERGVLTDILEGHILGVTGVDFSSDGKLLVSRALDHTVRIWRADTWETLAKLPETSQEFPRRGVAFHPSLPILATVGKDSTTIHIWNLDLNELEKVAAASRAVHYTNAKVVLVGDTGVGKSGLGLVLSGHDFVPTESTHGRHVWMLDTQDAQLEDGRTETREILLWDLAGQPGYRLIHQLHLTEVAVALVVFDARSETDPFSGVKHWNRALTQAMSLHEGGEAKTRKFLVAARMDRGGIAVSADHLRTLQERLAFDGYFETSAKEKWGVAELREAILQGIDWTTLPRVTSTENFQTIKLFLMEEKRAGRLLSTFHDLYHAYLRSTYCLSDKPDQELEFLTCAGRVESRGLIRTLSFGSLILLQPELLDAYASSIINVAKTEPHGSGSILEEDVLAGKFPISADERLDSRDLEKLLLIATVEELLRHEIALREHTQDGAMLVFPSQFTRDWPEAPDPAGKAVVIRFDGAILNIYATLTVRLSRSGLFWRREMWRDAAVFTSSGNDSCGLYLREIEEGRAELTLFFDREATEQTRNLFEQYVRTHVERRAVQGSFSREQILVCKDCGTPLTALQVERRRARGFQWISCSVCDSRVSLRRSRRVRTKHAEATVRQMDLAADTERDREITVSVLQGKIETGDYDVFLCHNSGDKGSVKRIGERLKEAGILPWLDEWELRPGLAWQQVLEEQIRRIKSAAVFVGESGMGPWEQQEINALLREFVERGLPVIPVLLSKAPPDVALPIFLRGLTWVDFRKRNPDPMIRLIWGITGRRVVR